MPEAARWHPVLRFARDYTFRDLKANNSILLGNSRTNPWVQPFEAKLGIRWRYDQAGNVDYPVDTWQNMKVYRPVVDQRHITPARWRRPCARPNTLPLMCWQLRCHS